MAVALGNWGSLEAVPVLAQVLGDPEPRVRGHAEWALGRVGAAGAVQALRGSAEMEEDAWVREEVAPAPGSALRRRET